MAAKLGAWIVLLLLAAIPATAAANVNDEHADCEAEPRPPAGTLGRIIMDAVDATAAPSPLTLCDGEHWDGQDDVAPHEPAQCGAPTAHASEGHANLCQSADPNDDAVPRAAPAGARASWRAEDPENVAVYAAADASHTGRLALHHDHCLDACGGEPTLRHGMYVRDNTPMNLVCAAWSVIALWTTVCEEGDCDHAAYERSRYGGPRPYCGRDNTAMTLEVALP